MKIPCFQNQFSLRQSRQEIQARQEEENVLLITKYDEIDRGVSSLATPIISNETLFSSMKASPQSFGRAIEFISMLMVEIQIESGWAQRIISALAQLISQ